MLTALVAMYVMSASPATSLGPRSQRTATPPFAWDEPRFHDALRYSLEDYFFLTALAEGRDPFPDFRTALEAHRLVDAIYRSARSGGAAVGVD